MGHYPVDFDVTYPMRRLDRLTTLLRPVLIVPIVLVLAAVAGPVAGRLDLVGVALTAGRLLFGGPLLMIVVRRNAFVSARIAPAVPPRTVTRPPSPQGVPIWTDVVV